MSDLDRLNALYIPEPMSGCWLWLGAINDRNYGRFFFQGKNRMAHRVSWQLHVGPIPAGLMACHKCDNPGCINPDHLFLGTNKDNSDDCHRKGRAAVGERHPRAYVSDEMVRHIRSLGTRSYRKKARALGIPDSTYYAIAVGRQRRGSL